MTSRSIINAMYADSPLVYGHRGAKAYAPMNTLPAFELAVAQGAHAIELDVQRSRDGYPVIMHDFTVDTTTNGHGRVSELTLSELKALDAGAWFASAFAGVQIPTLDEVFESVGHRVFVNVEIKAATLYTDGVEEVVANCIKRHQMQQRVLISSFNPHTLARFRACLPDVPIGYLYEGTATTVPADAIYEAYHPCHTLISHRLVADCRQRQQLINVWTVNDPARALELCALGVDGIITDKPDTILQVISTYKGVIS